MIGKNILIWLNFYKVRLALNIAKNLLARSAVSRAYYAAFCFARNYARDNQNFSPTYKTEDHGLIREHFRLMQMGKIARYLDHLRQWRNMCDYYDEITAREVTNVSNLPIVAIRRAQQIFDLLNKNQQILNQT